MSEEIFEEIKSVINTISILQSREDALRKDLEFFKQRWKDASKESHKRLFVGAAKRLEHEAMFLCIEVYSLHQGIEKQRALYSKVIKQNGKLLSKVDKTPRDERYYSWLGVIGLDEKRDFTSDEKNDFMQEMDERAYQSRKETRDVFGITSHKHDEMDEWLNHILDKDVLLRLSKYRDKFSHRLDSLENLKLELEPASVDSLGQMLDIVSAVLDTYKRCLQNIFIYTNGEQILGRRFKYDSLSRLKLAEAYIPHIRKHLKGKIE